MAAALLMSGLGIERGAGGRFVPNPPIYSAHKIRVVLIDKQFDTLPAAPDFLGAVSRNQFVSGKAQPCLVSASPKGSVTVG
jgi:hypothetical protein